ncbi:BON domain-containing protein [Legionella fairfieldensis]|uniref:BON domain-containing protein n=1 Tax=Legionella fairfieldensis TaxID=45064 RepID=UPI000490967A|nr:BON domain-containing protein [Legionella fairfieldensis]
MRKSYLFSLIIIGVALLAGCQKASNMNFFNSFSSDQALTSSVNSALINSEELSNLRIQVETQKGVVFLNGYVKTIRQSDTAGNLAANVPGVKGVQNGLIVRK